MYKYIKLSNKIFILWYNYIRNSRNGCYGKINDNYFYFYNLVSEEVC